MYEIGYKMLLLLFCLYDIQYTFIPICSNFNYRWTDVKMEYEEYITHSRDTEEELDFTLEQKQSIIKDLELTNHNLVKENDLLKVQ